MTGKAVEITLYYNLSTAFCEHRKFACEILVRFYRKKDFALSCVFKESASILKQANWSYSGLKLDVLWQNEAFLYHFSRHLLENPSKYMIH